MNNNCHIIYKGNYHHVLDPSTPKSELAPIYYMYYFEKGSRSVHKMSVERRYVEFISDENLDEYKIKYAEHFI